MAIKLQIVRKGTKYESYRITLPKSIVNALNLKNAELELKIEKGKIILVKKKH
jgi:bifunctional DNA-binding transcriptional regulator/antitoxin component of YhaV-PrlF toxin-antitoxin module